MNSKVTERSIKLAEEIRNYLQDKQLSANLSDISYEILALQLLDSIEQEKEIKALVNSDIGKSDNAEWAYGNPYSPHFDPIKAIVSLKETDFDEACWLVFLLIYTDDSTTRDWAFVRQLYSGIGFDLGRQKSDSKPYRLTWERLNQSPNLQIQQLESLSNHLAQLTPKPKFGHHRAYESLAQLPAVFSSYIGFINAQGGHQALFKPSHADIDKHDYFQALYSLVRQHIYRFGRLSTFEYLCLLGKLGLADVEPDCCYIAEASGPKQGAKLLFGLLSNEQLEAHAVGLADYLEIGYQSVEAGLCHWQKSPNRYIPH